MSTVIMRVMSFRTPPHPDQEDTLPDHLAPTGRYIYEDDLWTGAKTDIARLDAPYSMPRHAGTTYFLAQLYGATHEAWRVGPTERAFPHRADLLAQSVYEAVRVAFGAQQNHPELWFVEAQVQDGVVEGPAGGQRPGLGAGGDQGGGVGGRRRAGRRRHWASAELG